MEMGMRNGWFVVFLVLLAMPFAMGATVQEISLKQCGFSTTSMVCGSTTTFSCVVNDSFAASDGITQVQYNLGGVTYNAALTAGNSTVGTWSKTLTATESFPSTLTALSVYAVNTRAETCSGGSTNQTAPCVVTYTKPSSLPVSCTCTYSVSSPVCGTNNIATTTHTPSSGCTNASPFVTTSICDYCDPGWIVDSQSCSVGAANSSQATSGTFNRSGSFSAYGNYLQGFGQVSLTSTNPACCATTGLASDCTAPAASTVLSCRQDVWNSVRNQEDGAKRSFTTSQVTNLSSATTVSLTPATDANGNAYKPIVFDFDNDGETETAVLLSGGTIGIYDQAFESQKFSITVGGTFRGDPALFEFSPTAAGESVDVDWVNGVVGGGIAVITSYGSGNRFLSYRYNASAGAFQLLVNVSSSAVTEAQTPWCTSIGCRVVENAEEFDSINPITGATIPIVTLTGAVGGASLYWKNSPVKVLPDAGVYAMKGVGPGPAVYVYFCGTSGCTSIVTHTDFTGGSEVANISELTVAYDQAEIFPTYGESYPVYWTEYWSDLSNVTHADLNVAWVQASATTTPVVHNVESFEITSSGSQVSCVSNPAAASCPTGPGVALVTGFESTSVVSFADIDDAESLLFEADATAISSLSEYSTSGSSSVVAAASCYGSTCIQVQGRTNAATYGPQIVYKFDGSAWNNIGYPNDFGSTLAGDGLRNTKANTSDTVIAIGMIDENTPIVVIGSAFDAGIGASAGTPTIGVYSNMRVWKWTSGTTWTRIDGGTISSERIQVNTLSNSPVPASAFEMRCNQGVCTLFTGGSDIASSTNTTPTSQALGIVSIDRSSVEVFHPKGTVVGVNLNGTGQETVFVDYLKSSSGYRYVSFVRGESGNYFTGNGESGLVRYSPGSDTLFVTLGVRTTVADVKFAGLAEDDSGRVWWTEFPSLAGGSSVCVINSTDYSSSEVPLLTSSAVTITNPIIPPAGAKDTVGCNIRLMRDNSGSAFMFYNETFVMWRGNAPGGVAEPGFRQTSQPFAMFTGGGQYVAADLFSLCSATAALNQSCSTLSTVIMKFSNDGTEPAFYQSSGSGTFVSSDASNAICVADSSTCRPGVVNTVSARESAGATTSDQVSLMYGFAGGSFTYWLQDMTTTTSQFRTIGSVGTTGQEYTEYSCYDNHVTGSIIKSSSTSRSGTYCPSFIATADVDSDGKDEIVAYDGVFKTSGSSNRIYSFSGNTNAGSFVPVDVTSDSYTDFIGVTTSSIKRIVSRPPLTISIEDTLTLDSLVCTFDDDADKVTVVGQGVGAPNPNSITYTLEAARNGNFISRSTGAFTGTVTSGKLTSAGTYDFTLSLAGGGSSATPSATCQVVVAESSVNTTTTVAGSGICEIDPDGEFNYRSSVTSYGWTTGTNNVVPDTGDGQQATFFQADTDIYHGLSCTDSGVSAEVRIRTNGASAETAFEIWADTLAGRYGQSVPVASFKIEGDILYAYDDESRTVVINGFREHGSGPGGFKVITLIVDVDAQQYTIYVDGTAMGTFDVVNEFEGEYTQVVIRHDNSITDIDYVRTSGTTGISRDVSGASDFAPLLGCEAPSGRNFTADPVRGTSATTTTSFSHVSEYCNRVTDDGKCEYDDLRDAVQFNGDCYKEAFDYCVSVTYPESGGTFDTSTATMKTAQKTLDGAAACNMALGVAVASDRIAKPFWNAIWASLVSSNLLLTLVIVLVIAILLAAWGSRRR